MQYFDFKKSQIIDLAVEKKIANIYSFIQQNYFDENKSRSDVANDKLYSPQAFLKFLMHFRLLGHKKLLFISKNNILDSLIKLQIKKKSKITHKSFTLPVIQCSI